MSIKLSICLSLIFSLFSQISISQELPPVDPSTKEDPFLPSPLENYLNDLRTTTLSHNKKEFLALVDIDYREKQLDDMLAGDTSQFIKELFCGYSKKEAKSMCMEFEQILHMSFISIEKVGDYHEVTINITSVKHSLKVKLEIHYINDTFVIVGGYG